MNTYAKNIFRKSWLWLVVFLTAMTLAISACGGEPASNEEATGSETSAAEISESDVEETESESETTLEVEESEEVSEPMSESLPGDGITADGMYSGIIAELFQHLIVEKALEELGYTIGERAEAQYPAIHLALANGDVDFFTNHWDPLHESFYTEAGGADAMTRTGSLISGAQQGYLIDKATADEYGITNLEDFKDPEIATLFDSDGDGKANLIGCDPGWGCERVIEHHLDAYELRNSITHDQGAYFALIADGIARYEAGDPLLYYTWTPMWLGGVLVPDEDVVWLNVPFSSSPDGDVDTEAADGSNTGFVVNTLRVTANNDFLAANPAAAKLFEVMEIPIGAVMAENFLVNEGEDSESDIERHADEWISANQVVFDSWVDEALNAASE
jgi:glycine betaine/proline transport system substrate-binding protein